VLAVNASLFSSARAERFAQLVDEAGGLSRRRHSRSRLDDELAQLVADAQLLRDMPISVEADPIFKRDLRSQLMATAQREGIGITALDEEPEPRARLSRPRARGAIVIGLAAGTLALSGVSVASGEAIPGDALYGMKRSTERAQLALAGSDLTRGQLYLDFARTRLGEAYQVRDNQSGFVDALREMDIETQQGVRLLISTAIDKHDTTALDTIDGFVSNQRKLVAQMLDMSNGEAREKVTKSLALLTAVDQRAVAARSALACGAKASGFDELGPMLGGCAITATSHPGQAGQSTPSGQKPGTTGTGAAEAPQASASASPSGQAEAEKKDDGLLGELGRILGGLLGG
jgi:hypothetical protein